MAFPFKTGGDFYNCEAQRMRLHNLGANPTETATGLMYFNTGTSNLGKHAVVHDGTNFKALAFVDEIASNTAFTELANRVLTIEKALGEDTANVIDTWEEIQNFLKDIDDNDANLMTMLNDKLSLSKGGVMTGTIMVGDYTAFGQTGGNFYLGTPAYPLLLRSNGTTTINGNALIHSGNYNSYAPKLDGTGATGTWGINISGNANNATTASTLDGHRNGDVTARYFSGLLLTNTNTLDNISDGVYCWVDGNNPTNSIGDNSALLQVSGRIWDRFQLAFPGNNEGRIHFRNSYYQSMDYCGWNSWKKLAFLDDNVASATKLATPRSIWGHSFDGTGDVSGELSGVTNINSALYINSSGNVTIGGSDLAGSGYKLYVNGNVGAEIYHFVKNNASYGYIGLGSSNNNDILISTDATSKLWLNGNGNTIMNYYGGNVGIGTADPQYKLDVAGTGRFTGAVTMESTLSVGGNITPATNNAHSLGTSSSQWSHLYAVGATLSGSATIKGDLVVEGNIIGKKEVSAGGAGQEGESGAGGGAEVISQTLAKGASSYNITNTIKRSDIAVSLYEWNASGNSWDMCLADISITDSNITVTFGSATTVNHKLVAVG